MNIVEPILFQARLQPESPALCSLGRDVISYARLRNQMNNVARRAMSFGLRRGSVVALSITDPLLHSAVILGLTQIGVVPVSVGGHKPPDGLKIDAVLADRNYPFVPDKPHLTPDYSWIRGDGLPVTAAQDFPSDTDQVCRIVLTSGSTGEPRAVALTHRLAMARSIRFEYLLGDRNFACSRLFVNIGITALPGYNFLTYILGRGGALFFHGDCEESTLRSFEMFQIQALAAAPASLAQLLAICDRFPLINVRVDSIFLAGSMLSPALLERVRPRLCSHVFSNYGSTETGAAATAPAHRIAHIPGAAGYVVPGVRIEIVDEADCTVPAGTEGIVRIDSEFAVDRYIDDPVESAQVFHDGWFYPGDLGSLTADNLLVISGRQNSVLNAGGGKMAAEKIEDALLSFRGVDQAAVFMATSKIGVEEVWAGIVCNEKIDPEALQAHCRSRMPTVFVPARIVTLDLLPLNAGGKVDRAALKALLTSAAQAAS